MSRRNPVEIAEHSQIGECAVLYAKVFSTAPWHEQWTDETAALRLQHVFHTPNFIGYMVIYQQAAVGFVLSNVHYYQQERHCCIEEICVDPGYQRQGIGALLMQVMEERCVRDGLDRIYLLTMRDSPAALFYQKLGFYTSPKMILMGKRVQEDSVSECKLFLFKDAIGTC